MQWLSGVYGDECINKFQLLLKTGPWELFHSTVITIPLLPDRGRQCNMTSPGSLVNRMGLETFGDDIPHTEIGGGQIRGTVDA